MNLDLSNDNNLKELLTAAILREIDDEQKNIIISSAIKNLMEEKERGYNREKYIPMMEAFNRAAYDITTELARNYLKESEDFNIRFKELMKKALDKVFIEKQEEMINNIARSISEGFEVD